MVERGAWTWPEFAARLDGVDVSGEDTAHFYEHWLEALEDLLLERVLLEPTEIESRIAQQAASDQEHSH